MTRDRFFQICIQVVAVLALVMSLKRDLGYDTHPDKRPRPFDFRATYCGLSITAHHGNPYLAEPVRACEAGIERPANLPLPNQALPATMPPFAQVFFSPLGYFDSLNAQRIFYSVSFVALLASIWAVSQLSGFSLAFVAIPLVFGLYAPSSKLGTIAVFAFTGVAFTALFYQQKRYWATAAAFCFAMLQPQTGIAIFAAMFLKNARMRLPLIGAAAMLALLCLPLGLGRLGDYIQSLGVHSRAEQYQNTQLSLTFMLRHIGLTEQHASTLGTMAYVLWLACALIYVYRRRESDALDVLMPATIVLLPGSFVQTIYLATALIPALIFLRRYQSLAAFIGLALLTVTWQPLLRPSYDLYLILSLAGIAAMALATFPFKMSRWIALGSIVGILAFCRLFVHPLPPERSVTIGHPPAHFASSEWYTYRYAQDGPNFDVWMQKVPYVLALALIIRVALLSTSYGSRRRIPVQTGEFDTAIQNEWVKRGVL